MIDPLKKIEEKISILCMLHSEHSERLARVEALLVKHFDDTEVTSSHSGVKEMRKFKSNNKGSYTISESNFS